METTMFDIDPEKLEHALTFYIERNPDQASKFLDIISKALVNYKKAVDTDRSNIAIKAVSDTILLPKVRKFKGKQTKVPFLIDAAFILFPKGNCNGHSQVCHEYFEYFVQCCKDENTIIDHKDWLIEVKGREYYDWLKLTMSNLGLAHGQN